MEYGECVITRYEDADLTWRLYVDRADPLVYVTDDLFRQVERGEGLPHAEAGEGILVIRGSNGTVRYRLQDYDPLEKRWTARLLSCYQMRE
jgi:hypothetical protein